MLLQRCVTFCLRFVTTPTDIAEDRQVETLCQVQRTRFLQFIGRDFVLVVRMPHECFVRDEVI